MASNESRSQVEAKHPIKWRQDLDQVGFVRQMLHGAQVVWWRLVVCRGQRDLADFCRLSWDFSRSGLPLIDPRAEVGPSLLAPGPAPLGYVLMVQSDSG